MKNLTLDLLKKFELYLVEEEKAKATREKYMRDVHAFFGWMRGKIVDKATVVAYKAHLESQYAPASVNAAISSLNSFFCFNEWYDLRIKALRIQRRIFSEKSKELTKEEYYRLLCAAKQKRNRRLYLLMQTICSTGIRVSELKSITVEAVYKERATIRGKGKLRTVILPQKLCAMLRTYIKEEKRESGAVFVTQNGKPLNRSNIWLDMKKLCSTANVAKEKVFPHNLRHLFARTYYSIQKDIVRLADILGHASINTTRLYTMESGEVHKQHIQRLGLLIT